MLWIAVPEMGLTSLEFAFLIFMSQVFFSFGYYWKDLIINMTSMLVVNLLIVPRLLSQGVDALNLVLVLAFSLIYFHAAHFIIGLIGYLIIRPELEKTGNLAHSNRS